MRHRRHRNTDVRGLTLSDEMTRNPSALAVLPPVATIRAPGVLSRWFLYSTWRSRKLQRVMLGVLTGFGEGRVACCVTSDISSLEGAQL